MATADAQPAQSVVEPATLVPRRRPGYVGAVHVTQIMLLEAIMVIAVYVFRHSGWLLVAAAAGGLLVLAAAFGRRGGRWWVEYAMLRRQFRRRRSSGQLAADDRRLDLLHDLVPDLTADNVEGAGGGTVGVGSDSAGWFAVITLAPQTGMRGTPHALLPVAALTTAIGEARQPGAVLQMVTHIVPAPSVMADAGQRCSQSYTELLRPVGGPAPADQLSWLALRLGARALAQAAVGADAATAEAPVVVAALVRLASKALKRAGVAHQVLDADGMLDALLVSLDLAAGDTDDTDRSAPPQEQWRRWHSSSMVHASFWVRDWPALQPGGELLDLMARSAAATTTIATIVEPGEDGTDLRCLVRLGAEPADLERASASLEEIAVGAGARLLRLDGEHALAAWATAPSGGGAL